MKTPLLATKFFIPQPRKQSIPRPRLIDLLEAGLEKKLTLISAPAGFGKSTLLSEWAAGKKNNLVWLSLDENDSEPVRFFTYLIAALNQAKFLKDELGAGARALLTTSHELPFQEILSLLINDLAGLPRQAILILDDYHLIDSKSVDENLSFLLSHQPGNLHLVIATRDDPQLPLAQLRAKGQLNELRASHLRFTHEEAAKFLNTSMGLSLSPEDVRRLAERTEGWIAGLQLAAISLKDSPDASAMIHDFSGSHRFILDYLIEEVLEKQPPHIQDFLLITSILSRFNAPLCDTLTGRTDSAAIIAEFEKANLFITPLDSQRNWYRYHHLFRELLLQRLRELRSNEINDLNRKAAEWCMENNMPEEAIDYSLQAQDFAGAADLIEARVADAWRSGRDTSLNKWVDMLPLKEVTKRPQLNIYYAWGLFSQGKAEEAEAFLQQAEEFFQIEDEKSKLLTGRKREVFIGGAETMKAFMAFYRGDENAIIGHAQRALEYLPQREITWRNTATIALADAYVSQGNYHLAITAREQAFDTVNPNDDLYHYMVASVKYLITLRNAGRLQQALELCRDRLDMAKARGIAGTEMVGWMLCVWAEILAETNDLKKAQQMAVEGMSLVENSRDVPLLSWCRICQTRIRFSSGDLQGAQEAIRANRKLFHGSFVPPWFQSINDDWQARIWLAGDAADQARQWAEGIQQKSLKDCPYNDAIPMLTLARVRVSQDRAEETLNMLVDVLACARKGGHVDRMIQALILLAIAQHAARQDDESRATLAKALALSRPGGYIRAYLDEGSVMEHLLREFRTEDDDIKEYVRQLLNAFRVDKPGAAPGEQPLIEPLSERELEVLALISQGLTNQQIAENLYLSLNTVKGHTRNIYQKLGVRSRTQSVQKAAELDILPKD